MRQVFWVSCMRSNFFTLSSFFLDFSYGQLLSLECSALRQFLYTTGKWPRRLVIIDRLKVGKGGGGEIAAIFLLTQFHLRKEIIWVKTRIKRSLAKPNLLDICVSVVQKFRKNTKQRKQSFCAHSNHPKNLFNL